MPMRPLGDSDMLVSKVGIGAMMWGEQIDEATAAALLDVAFDEFGVNLIVRDGFVCTIDLVTVSLTAYFFFPVRTPLSSILCLRTKRTMGLLIESLAGG